MAAVEKLLTAALVEIRTEDPENWAALFCMNAYYAELDSRFESGFQSELSLTLGSDDLTEPAGLLVVAYLRNEPIGCGALKFRDGGLADVKRMWLAPEIRGREIGRRLLEDLESRARSRGRHSLRLDTHRHLEEAISLYRTSGLRAVAAYNQEPYANHWFMKRLSRTSSFARKVTKTKRK